MVLKCLIVLIDTQHSLRGKVIRLEKIKKKRS